MLKGKDLKKAKSEKIGLLPDKGFNKIKRRQRKVSPRYETGMTSKGKIIPGTEAQVSSRGADHANLKAHTHPELSSSTKGAVRSFVNSHKNTKNIDGNVAIDKVTNHTFRAAPSGDPYRRMGKLSPSKARRLQKDKGLVESKAHPNKIMENRTNPDPLYKELKSDFKNMVRRSKTEGGKNTGAAAHNIVAPGATGVHKYRKDHIGQLRSVYFDKGWK